MAYVLLLNAMPSLNNNLPSLNPLRMRIGRAIKKSTGFQFLLILLMQINVIAQSASDKEMIRTLQFRLPQLLDSAAIPAISIAVIKKGEIVWTDAFGLVSKETKQPVNKTSIFEAASLGKPVFAYAVLTLCDAGKINLDVPLVQYVAKQYLEQHFLNASIMDKRFDKITARMVLSHTSGLPNWRSQKDSLALLFAPGERYSYSGEGFSFLQTVVEYVTGLPIDQWMQKTVFEPLKMKRTSYVYQSKDSSHYVISYDNSGNSLHVDKDALANVAHTLHTTAVDYAQFIIALMNGTGLKKETSQLLFETQVETDLCGSKTIYWGLGIALQKTAGDVAFLQWGKSNTASGYMFGFAEQKSAVVYFTSVANQGLRIGVKLVELTQGFNDPLFSCFRVKQYNQ